MCFRLIDAKKAQHPVSLLCERARRRRAGYYAWKQRPASERAASRRRAARRDPRDPRRQQRHVRLAAGARRAAAPRRAREPQARRAVDAPGRAVGHGCAAARAARQSRSPAIATAPDLVRRDFAPTAPNRLWVADLTEIATWEGKLYLAVVVDCFSRRCVGWAMAEHMRAELVVDALEMARLAAPPRRRTGPSLRQRRPVRVADLRPALRAAGIDVSMGAKGCALDNAVCEAFFATLKKELIRRRSWPTRRELQSAVFAWIEGWYNRRRLHSTLGYHSPARLREQHSRRRRCESRRFAARIPINDDQGEGCVDQPQRVHRNGSGPVYALEQPLSTTRHHPNTTPAATGHAD